MPGQDKQFKPSDSEQEAKDLQKLLSLLNTPASKQQLPSLHHGTGISTPRTLRPSDQSVVKPCSGANQHQSTEAVQLEQFSLRYQKERKFSTHSHHKLFCEIFSSLTKKRLCSQDWLLQAPPENILRVLVCLRILMRDGNIQKLFFQLHGVKFLSEHFRSITDSYLNTSSGHPYSRDILKETTNLFQKLSAVEEQREWLVACDAHKSLVLLLSATDICVLHCCLHALIGLAQSPRPRQLIGELNSIHVLLRIIQEYDTISKKLAANLLKLLCGDPQSCERIKLYDGIPVLLSQLHSDNAQLLYHIVWCLVQLCEDDPDGSNLMQKMGAIPLLLALLQEQKFVSERTDASRGTVASNGTKGQIPSTEDEDLTEKQYQLKSACCAALNELVLNDTNAQQIVQANGVYVLSMLVLPPPVTVAERERKLAKKLQMSAFRTLRFLFSMERNRHVFKELFPPDLFEKFIDVGHYNKDLKAYKPLVDTLNKLPNIEDIIEKIHKMNQSRTPNHYIGEYAVFELLGTGAFGSVYKVRRRTARQSFLAMKELNLQNSAFGKNAREKAQSVGEIVNELKIMKECLKHPNVVRYHTTFEENDKLYIVMELIEGATLADHFNSLKEKKGRFDEPRIWNIFIQLVLALRYLHKEKGIVHRDLTPNNIMLGENDKVTITDFGLAKQKRSDSSKMMSVVGTIIYSCPEIVQNQPYGEKADIWALGCILYQMATLEPPFFSNNMLSLVKKIVAAEYKPVTDAYSKRLIHTITRCLTVAQEERPDVLDLCSELTDILLVYIDNLRVTQTGLQRKLDRERKRTQKHFCEANVSMKNYHQLFLASQQQYDYLLTLSGSDGAQRIRDTEEQDSVFPDSPVRPELSSDSSTAQTVALSLTSITLGEERNNSDHYCITDDDSYPSSGSESRESSAGSVRSLKTLNHNPVAPQHPPTNTPNLLRDVRRRVGKRSVLSSLMVDIPQIAKSSRDSGLSSDDPSPNTSHSSSTGQSPTTNLMFDQILSTQQEGAGMRPLNRSQSSDAALLSSRISKRVESHSKSAALLTIAPNRLREISDPILQMMQQLHKIVYITQLPPTLESNPSRYMVEQYKRALFCPGSTALNLKSELRKLVVGSREIIDLDLALPDVSRRSLATCDQDACSFNADNPVTGEYDPDYKDVGITYEYMQSVIEECLLECGYYDVLTSPNEKNMRRNIIST